MMIKLIAVFLSVILVVGVAPSIWAQQAVPDWIKQTVKWYANGTISEQEFLSAIKYLITNKIIVIEEEVLADPTLDVKQVTVTKPKVKQCEILFQSYKNLRVDKFKAKYKHVTYLDECIKLYKDSIWKYKGDDRHDKLYQKLVEFEELEKVDTTTYEPYVKINSKINVGKDKYDIKYNVCAGSKQLDKAKVLIKSQIESIELGTNKDIPANTCRTYQTQINAKNVDNIFIDVLEQVLK